MAGFPKQSHSKAKTLIIEDDCKEQDQGESNPFSFKEFVKNKTHTVQNVKNCDRAYSKVSKESTTLFSEPDDCVGVSLEFQETFFKEPTLYEGLVDDEEEDWSGSYHPSVIEHNHNARAAPSLGCAYDESYGYSASDLSGEESFTTWHPAGRTSPGSSGSCKKSVPHPSGSNNSVEDLRFHTLQINYEELQEENSHLKRKICELKELNETQAEMVRHFERKLEEKILEEQKEAQDLESMVQQVEKNLQMMTKKAAKAESNVTKLKQEVTLLQIQLATYKAENEALRRGETAGMNAVKQNTNLALENLHKVIAGAQSSIKQLVSGAEALNLVADLLRSIDKIAEIHQDDVP
ncbi:endosome-associated-trafficking regulator 1 [Rhinophrynus dorsalis]